MMIFKPVLCAVLIVTCLQCLDCQKDRPESSRLNFFDIDLLKYSAEDKVGNIMVSPASIKSVLAVTLEGARGVTESEIRSALRLPPNQEDFRQQLIFYFRALYAINSTGVALENANAVFVSTKYSLKRDYETMLRNVYKTEVRTLDFTDTINTANVINQWVGTKTKGLIPFIVGPENINPSAQIVLANAIYFKGLWQHAFNPSLTKGMCFFDKGGGCKTVAMMDLNAELNYAYVDNLRAHAVELPYVGGHYSMILLVPVDKDGSVALLRDLPYMSLPAVISLLEPTDVQLLMPKFTVHYSEDLVVPLRSMRIRSLFSESANLTGVFDGKSPKIDSIFHKVYMSVDELGTVAAAASAAMIVPLISGGVQLKIDRPFVFFIRDNNMGLVLFEGKIDDPTPYVAPPVEPTAPVVPVAPIAPAVPANAVNDISREKQPPLQAISQPQPTPPVTTPTPPIVKVKRRFGFF